MNEWEPKMFRHFFFASLCLGLEVSYTYLRIQCVRRKPFANKSMRLQRAREIWDWDLGHTNVLCIYVMTEKPQSPKTVAEKLKRRINLNHNLIVGVLSRQILENVHRTTSIPKCNQRTFRSNTNALRAGREREKMVFRCPWNCGWIQWLNIGVLIVHQFCWFCMIIVCRCLLHKPFKSFASHKCAQKQSPLQHLLGMYESTNKKKQQQRRKT